MPRYEHDLTKVRAAFEPTKAQMDEHDQLQAEGQAAFEEERDRVAEHLSREWKLSDAQRENLLWRRLGWLE